MKLTIAWNVWNTYEDVLLGSEIARMQTAETGLFSDLMLISQGGYPEPPTADEARYLDGHHTVAIDETHPMIARHGKFRGVFRVLNGIRHAFELARDRGSDVAVVTNGDAWCLSMERLHALLARPDVARAAVSARVGTVTGLDLNYGAFAPFFDDHFLILNIAECDRLGVFAYDEPRAYRSHFVDYGGIHYMLGALFDERVPPGAFNAYTHVEDGLNHFGEKSAFSLLPWQYQPSLAFLHANCAQEPDLHPLRAALLRHQGLDRFPAVAQYCQRHPAPPGTFASQGECVFYRQTWAQRLAVRLQTLPLDLYYAAGRRLVYDRRARLAAALFGPAADPRPAYARYRGVLPMALASRRRAG